MKHALRIGLVDFSDPTMLLFGEPSAFDWLADQIADRRAVVLDCEPGNDLVRFLIAPSMNGGKVSRMDTIFEWLMSPEEAVRVSQQLRELAASPLPGHAYLDPASNVTGVQIMASKGEYDPARIFAENKEGQG